MKSEITVSEICQTSTTTETNEFQLTVVAVGNKELVRAYAKSISILPLYQVDAIDTKPCAVCGDFTKSDLVQFCMKCGRALGGEK